MTLLIMKYFHILSAALWWAAPISVPRSVRAALAQDPAQSKAAIENAVKSQRLATYAGGVTLITGFVLIMQVGGMKAVSPTIHVAMLTAIALLVVNLMGSLKTLRKIEDSLATEPAAAAQHLGKLGMFAGIQHGLWALTLGLMVFRNLNVA